MIENYFKELDEFITAADEIIKVEIIRRNIWDTDLEIIGIYRYRILFRDESLLEMTERMVEERDQIKRTKYRFHWQDREGKLIKRWDNARHHPEIDTFPHHLHIGSDENVTSHRVIDGLEILSKIVEEIAIRQ